MKVEVLNENLKEALGYTERIVGKNLTLPILNNILIETENNFLCLKSTDLETAIKWWLLSKIFNKGKVVIPAYFLSNFISFLPKEKIFLEEKNQNLLIKCQNYQTQIQGQNPDDFPIIPDIPKSDFIEVDNKQFCEGLTQIADIVSTSQTRPEITGIYFSFFNDILKIAGTDSFRLAEKTIHLQKPIEKEYSFILPQKPAKEIINILGGKDGKLKIYFSPNQILFEFPMTEIDHPQLQINSRLIEGEYPNYQEIIPKKFKTQVVLKKEDFLNQIKAASLFSGKINEVKFIINTQKKQIEITSQNPNIGEYKSSLEAKIEGVEKEVSFNYKFLIDGLLNIKSSEVIFNLNKDDNPCLLKPVGDLSYLYVVMPIKTT